MMPEWRWSPTEAQRNVFEEWKQTAICFLVACRDGCNIRSIQKYLEEHTGNDILLENMGFRTINEFLCAMHECIELRPVNGQLFVFIRESSVPVEAVPIRQLVLNQRAGKGKRRRTGVIMQQSSYVRPEELLEDQSNTSNETRECSVER